MQPMLRTGSGLAVWRQSVWNHRDLRVGKGCTQCINHRRVTIVEGVEGATKQDVH
jgi:hypothetical protein